GRVTMLFHADEPAIGRFVAILSGAADLSRSAWQAPSIGLPGADETAAFLIVPRGAFELPAGQNNIESGSVPEWIKDIIPAAAVGDWNAYRRSGGTPSIELRPARGDSPRLFVDSARVDLWPMDQGTVHGRLGLHLAGN